LKESSIASKLNAFSCKPFPNARTENLCTRGQDLPEQHLVLTHILQSVHGSFALACNQGKVSFIACCVAPSSAKA